MTEPKQAKQSQSSRSIDIVLGTSEADKEKRKKYEDAKRRLQLKHQIEGRVDVIPK